jgi:hypothetical protein
MKFDRSAFAHGNADFESLSSRRASSSKAVMLLLMMMMMMTVVMELGARLRVAIARRRAAARMRTATQSCAAN